jgi:hypothetical protein
MLLQPRHPRALMGTLAATWRPPAALSTLLPCMSTWGKPLQPTHIKRMSRSTACMALYRMKRL